LSYSLFGDRNQSIGTDISDADKRDILFEMPFSPIVANTPQAAQMSRQGPTAPEYSRTALGEMKMPEPIIVPTIRQMPLNRPT